MVSFRRAILAACLACLSASAISQDSSQKISFETAGESADRVLADIAAQANLNLKADAILRRDVLAVHFAGVPVRTALDKIAEAVNGSWTQDGDAMRLGRTLAQVKAEKQAARDRFAQGFQKAIAKRQTDLAKLPPFDEHEAAVFADQVQRTMKTFANDERYGDMIASLSRQGPAGRTIGRVLSTFDPRDLADLPLHLKVAYSTDPTATQRPFPGDVSDIVNEFLREQTLWSHEASAHHMESALKGGGIYAFPMNVDIENLFASTPAKALLTASRQIRNGPITFELIIVDGKGAIVGRTRDDLSPLFPDEAPIKTPAGGQSLQIPSDARELMVGAFRHTNLSQGNRAKLLQPEKIDPLSLLGGPLLLQCAATGNQNLVAVLSDADVTGGIRDGTRDLTVDQYLLQLETVGADVHSEGDWLIVKPKDAWFERETRTDRNALGTMLRLVDAEGTLNVDQEATSALALPIPLDNFMASELKSRLLNEQTAIGDVFMLRLYGALTLSQRQAAVSPRGLSLASLNETQRALLDPIVYSSYTDMQLKSPRDAQFAAGAWKEATESMPNGVPSNAVLKLKVDEHQGVFDVKDTAMRRGFDAGAYSAGEMAYQIFAKEHPGLANTVRAPLDTNAARFKVGTLQTFNFTFDLSPKLFLPYMVQARSLAKGNPVALSGLPSDFQDQVRQMLAEIVNQETHKGPTVAPGKSATSP